MRTAKKSAKNGEIDILEIPRRNIGGDRLQNPLSRIWQARPYDQTGAGCIGGININNTVPQTSSIYPNSTDNIGAVFFSPTGKALATMSMRSIERVVNNRDKARDKHWNQIKKRP